MAPRRRFERPTCRLGGGCSIQLSYRGEIITDERRLLYQPVKIASDNDAQVAGLVNEVLFCAQFYAGTGATDATQEIRVHS